MARKRVCPVEVVDVGDTIKLTWTSGAIEKSTVGIVAHIDRAGSDRILLAEDNQEIGRYNVQRPREVVCEMIRAYDDFKHAMF